METLNGKNVVVIGATGAVGSEVVQAFGSAGAKVLAVARSERDLNALAEAEREVDTLALDAASEPSAQLVFGSMLPDILVIASGARPKMNPIQQQTWPDFSSNWQTDVKITFQFCKEALLRPLIPGSTVFVISSGAALAGSSHTGGYAGAKRTEMFIAAYCQKESDRLGIGIKFYALAPRMMPKTQFGGQAARGYAEFQGLSLDEFVRRLPSPPEAKDVAAAVLTFMQSPTDKKPGAYIVSADRVEAIN